MSHIVPARLYWTADKTRLVGENDPDAAFLAFPAGEELSDEEARRRGLLSSPKAQTPTVNKLGARPADKATTKVAPPKETSS